MFPMVVLMIMYTVTAAIILIPLIDLEKISTFK